LTSSIGARAAMMFDRIQLCSMLSIVEAIYGNKGVLEGGLVLVAKDRHLYS